MHLVVTIFIFRKTLEVSMVATREKDYKGTAKSKSSASKRMDSARMHERSARKKVLNQLIDEFGTTAKPKSFASMQMQNDASFNKIYVAKTPGTFNHTNPLAGQKQNAAHAVQNNKKHVPIAVWAQRKRVNDMLGHKLAQQQRNASCGKGKVSVKNMDGSYSCRMPCEDNWVRNPASGRCVMRTKNRKRRAAKTCRRSQFAAASGRCMLRSRAELAKMVDDA